MAHSVEKTIPLVHQYHFQGVCFLTLNQPRYRNPLGARVVAELSAAMARVAQNPKARAVVLRGAGRVFSAGGNLGNFQERLTQSNAQIAEQNRFFGRFLEFLDEFPLPIIAVVEGAAIGGGMGLASVADSVLSTPDAVFSLTETTLGLIPAQIYPFVAKRIGASKAKYLSISGMRIDGQTAQRLGLVDQLLDAERLEADIARHLTQILRSAPQAIRQFKTLAQRFEQKDETIGAFLDASADSFAHCLRKEAEEGIIAFKEKRPPHWAQEVTTQILYAAMPKRNN